MLEWLKFLADLFSKVFSNNKTSGMVNDKKDSLYQPLLNEIEELIKGKGEIVYDLDPALLEDVVINEYKYGVSRKLHKKCKRLYILIEEYNKIDVISVAHNIIVGIFKRSYEELYGSVIDDVSCVTDQHGNPFEIEHFVPPYESIQQYVDKQLITDLLKGEGMPEHNVCVDRNLGLYDYIYRELVMIFHSVLNEETNGRKHKLPKLQKEVSMQPEEYMAINNFFDVYNTDWRIRRKYDLKKQIIEESNCIIDDLKKRIRRIVKKT
ncbi:hypothetical protein [Alkalibacillus haloalkaliphilus]|uniref:hypothetical protein n=1 Tax=Alkalibacillus haloalkaliphilus TaxID=94136 RepID=UPI00293606E8|nr:hypothetical protein [Alkalibacillus haloalkaliphilus]MDV2581667.1 hypothetical protein [Alkalibacillus haloalkaliphilus]